MLLLQPTLLSQHALSFTVDVCGDCVNRESFGVESLDLCAAAAEAEAAFILCLSVSPQPAAATAVGTEDDSGGGGGDGGQYSTDFRSRRNIAL
jgi:hypothetical protein